MPASSTPTSARLHERIHHQLDLRTQRSRARQITTRWSDTHTELTISSAIDDTHPHARELLDALLELTNRGDHDAAWALLERFRPAIVTGAVRARRLDLDDVLTIAWSALTPIARTRPARPNTRYVSQLRRELLTRILGHRPDCHHPEPSIIYTDTVPAAPSHAQRAIPDTEATAVANLLCDQLVTTLRPDHVTAFLAHGQGHTHPTGPTPVAT